MDWEYLFKPHILDRGYEYHSNELVENFNEENGKVTAEVLGSERYDVEITYDGDEIVDMYCTCPYAESGNCKHMAAVLFQQDDEIELTERKNQKSLETVAELVDEAEEKAVRDFLTKVLENDEELLLRFKTMACKSVTRGDINAYKCRVKNIVHNHSDYGGFISYEHAYDFAMDLDNLLRQDIKQMLELGNYAEAFELSCYILQTIGETEVDDSDGGTAIVAVGCKGVWQSVLKHADTDAKRQLFQWFAERLDRPVIDYLQDYVEEFLMEEFQEQEFLEEKLALVDQKLKEGGEPSDYYSRYKQERWIKRRIALMKALGKTEAQVEDFCKEYWKLPYVRRYFIDDCVDREDYGKAIAILEESMDIDKDYHGLVADYGLDLKELYLETGQKEAYLDMLWKLELELLCGDMTVFKELAKQYTPEQWKVERERVFEKLAGRWEIAELFLEEKLYDCLMDYVQKSPGLFALYKYEQHLSKQYPAEILEKYRVEVEKMAKPTTGRKQYKDIVSILECMKKYPGGPEVTAALVSQWKTLYRNRRAMMEELNRV